MDSQPPTTSRTVNIFWRSPGRPFSTSELTGCHVADPPAVPNYTENSSSAPLAWESDSRVMHNYTLNQPLPAGPSTIPDDHVQSHDFGGSQVAHVRLPNSLGYHVGAGPSTVAHDSHHTYPSQFHSNEAISCSAPASPGIRRYYRNQGKILQILRNRPIFFFFNIYLSIVGIG